MIVNVLCYEVFSFYMLTKWSHRTEKSIYSFDKSYYTHKQIYCVCSYVFYLGQENIRVYLLLCNTCDLPRVFSFHDLINISCLSYKCDYDVLYMLMHIYILRMDMVYIYCTYIYNKLCAFNMTHKKYVI